MVYFENFVDRFLVSKEPNIQLDLLKKNGQVLIQLFHQKDMLKWDLDFEIKNVKGFSVLIFFNKGKDNNELNEKRFNEMEMSKEFIYSSSLGIGAYFLLLDEKISTKELCNKCYNLITDVYKIEAFDFSLEAY